ncbi:MAG TPA: signal peptidase II [Syntrophomonadaceae bacterium]|nr:signal peptidase II [Syntrophomonadaceae bacterium]
MRFIISFLIILSLDQVSKFWIINNFEVGQSISLIDGIFSLTYVQNAGAAFGILQGKSWFFIIIAFIVIGFLSFYNYTYTPIFYVQYFSGFIVGGTVGNLIDRLLYGSVIDFLSIGWWPVFNIADIGIVCGSIGLLIYLFFIDGSDNLNAH